MIVVLTDLSSTKGALKMYVRGRGAFKKRTKTGGQA